MPSAKMNSNNGNSSNRAQTQTERPLCRYFASNICHKGDHCEFSHDRNARPDMVCRYYLKGECTYGSRCRYDHNRPSRVLEARIGDGGNSPAARPANNSDNPIFMPTSTPNKSMTKMPAFVPSIPAERNASGSPLTNFHQTMGMALEQVGPAQAQTASSSAAQKKIADIPLCPYFELGMCPAGDYCQFVHGLPCDMCRLNVLHPQNEQQRLAHHRQCLAEHEQRMEEAFAEARSAEMQCGICMEWIVARGLRFGILQNCGHCYCLGCIRKWRKHTDDQIQAKTVRACPECRVHSDYVIPSKHWIEDKAQKERLVTLFRENTKKIQCKYVQSGNMDKCPFGNKCFYKHQMPDGTLVEGKSPTAMRNERRRRFTFQDFLGLADSSSPSDDEISFGEFLRRGLGDLALVDSDDGDEVADW